MRILHTYCFAQHTKCSPKASRYKPKEDHITSIFSGQEVLKLSGAINRDCIDFLRLDSTLRLVVRYQANGRKINYVISKEMFTKKHSSETVFWIYRFFHKNGKSVLLLMDFN